MTQSDAFLVRLLGVRFFTGFLRAEVFPDERPEGVELDLPVVTAREVEECVAESCDTELDASSESSSTDGRLSILWARLARCDFASGGIFIRRAPSTTRSKKAIANGGSPRYSPHDSKSMLVTKAVEL
jgi:hypothetical protein